MGECQIADEGAAIAYYDRDPGLFGARYAEARFEDVHRHIIPYLPQSGATVLDVGSGSGRDAHILSALGYQVTAVEPSSAFQRWGLDHYGCGKIEWLIDRLPALDGLTKRTGSFSFILCSAVLIHLAPQQLSDCFLTFARLLTRRGKLAVSVRDAIASDRPGVFFQHSDRTLRAAANAAGFDLVEQVESRDALGRPDVTWRSFIFRKMVTVAAGTRRAA